MRISFRYELYVEIIFKIGYYDAQTTRDDYNNSTSYASGRWHTDTIADFNNTYNGVDDPQTSVNDKDESEPLSYNSRPFHTTSSLRGLNESRYGEQSEYIFLYRHCVNAIMIIIW